MFENTKQIEKLLADVARLKDEVKSLSIHRDVYSRDSCRLIEQGMDIQSLRLSIDDLRKDVALLMDNLGLEFAKEQRVVRKKSKPL